MSVQNLTQKVRTYSLKFFHNLDPSRSKGVSDSYRVKTEKLGWRNLI